MDVDELSPCVTLFGIDVDELSPCVTLFGIDIEIIIIIIKFIYIAPAHTTCLL